MKGQTGKKHGWLTGDHNRHLCERFSFFPASFNFIPFHFNSIHSEPNESFHFLGPLFMMQASMGQTIKSQTKRVASAASVSPRLTEKKIYASVMAVENMLLLVR